MPWFCSSVSVRFYFSNAPHINTLPRHSLFLRFSSTCVHSYDVTRKACDEPEEARCEVRGTGCGYSVSNGTGTQTRARADQQTMWLISGNGSLTGEE